MKRGMLFVLIWLSVAPAIAQEVLPATAGPDIVSDALPVLFDGAVRFRWRVPGNEEATAALQNTMPPAAVAADGHVTEVRLTVPDGAVIELVSGKAFVPQPLPGFGAVYGQVWPIAVDAGGQQSLPDGNVEFAGRWVGVRNRFYAVVLSDMTAGQVLVKTERDNEPRISIVPVPGQTAVLFRLYAGPVEHNTLRTADPVLTGLLFASLWNWLRWLCFGMLWLLTAIHGVVGSTGWSIVVLSLAVKILMTPLTKTADRLQASVNEAAALLQPQIAAIKRDFGGEEAHNRILAVYKKYGVHPLYTLRSLAGFLIQVPVFIAAFDMLGDNFALHAAPFLWIADLSRPDQWLALPVTLPFFGGYLNLLPCLMTALTLLTSWLQKDDALTPELIRRQRVRLFWMAGAFFLLFYTFPAGMVLYWTTNNALALARLMPRLIGTMTASR